MILTCNEGEREFSSVAALYERRINSSDGHRPPLQQSYISTVVLGFLKERRRNELKTKPFPSEWLDIIRRRVAFFARLSKADQAELLGHIQVFLAEKRFEGCAGFEIIDEIRVTIAAQACLLLLHRKTDYFPRLLTILVYTSTYLVDEQRHIEGPIWEEGKMSRLGETGRTMRSMVLAWDAVQSGADDPSDGQNIVLHEFAHQLDYENDAADGAPALATHEQQLSWREVMTTEFASLRAADDTGIPTLLNTYGATNPAEFFAVAVEAFFEQPAALRSTHPRLYKELRRYFNQNPIEYSAERRIWRD
ncbi:MAG TPA: M90 family metallopeptidase [Chthoniobacterales bacterium]|nr:M90 family metallopeptidase [Chthoniobacterales bacterium]